MQSTFSFCPCCATPLARGPQVQRIERGRRPHTARGAKRINSFAFRLGVWCIEALTRAVMPAPGFEYENIMPSTMAETAVMQKTRELRQTILDQPGMQAIRQQIDAFMADPKARGQYESLVSKGQVLQEKQQHSMALPKEEIDDFEQNRDALLSNPVARGFLDAQEELQQVKQSVQQYVNKALELGRLPTEEELDEGCCSHGGCGCGH